MKKIISGFAILLSALNLCAGVKEYRHTVRFKHYNLETGLPGETVRAVFQDHKGRLWLSIESVGLCRFDGVNYKVYSHLPNDFTTISSDFIQAIVEDKYGNLWIGTDHGLNRLSVDDLDDFSDVKFTRYLHSSDDEGSLSGNLVHALFIDSDDNFWIGTSDGLDRYNASKEIFEKYSLGDRSHCQVFSIFQDAQGNLWIGTDMGLYRISKKNKITHWSKATNAGLNHDQINAICQDGKGKLWVGTQNGINLFDPVAERFTTPDFEECGAGKFRFAGINKIIKTADGKIWLSTLSYGFLIYDVFSGVATYINSSEENPDGLLSDQVRDIYEDKEGSIWVATKSEGLHLYDRRSEVFGFLSNSGKKGRVLNDNSILAVYEDRQSNLWIGTKFGGLNKYSAKSQKFTYYTHDPHNPQSLGNNRVESIAEDKNGTLWIATVDGLNKLDPGTGLFSHYEFVPVKVVCIDRSQTIWLGTREGIYIFDPISEKYIPFRVNGRSFPVNDPVTAIAMDHLGCLWFGTMNKGLILYNPETNRCKWLHHEENDRQSLNNNMVRTIYEDSQNRVWIGTKLNGLNLYDRNAEQFQHFGRDDGLASNSVFSILEGMNGNLWLATNNGISRFNYEKKEFVNFSKEYGLQGDVFVSGAACKTRDGMLYFGGNNGLNYFFPSLVKKSKKESQILITAVKVYDKVVGKDVIQDGKMFFDHDDYLSFEFALLNYYAPQKNRYAYRLKGLNNKWVYSGSRNYVSYINLEPGSYQFQVKGANLDGVWNKNAATVSFTVRAPWYLSVYAFAVYGVAAFFLTWFFLKIFRYRSKKKSELKMLIMQKEQAEKISRFKLRFFTNVSHELRTPLTLILPPIEQLREIKGMPVDAISRLDLIERNSKRLGSLIDELLEFRKIEQGSICLKLQRADIVGFTKEITRNFVELAQARNINFFLHSEISELETFFDPGAVEKILSNLLSNAFKFTGKNGSISVNLDVIHQIKNERKLRMFKRFRRRERFLQISVKDNGAGISRKDLEHIFERFYRASSSGFGKGLGIGLDLAKSLTELHHGKIKVMSREGLGSEFVVLLPLEDHYYIKEKISEKPLNIEDHIIDFYSIHAGEIKYRTREDSRLPEQSVFCGPLLNDKDAELIAGEISVVKPPEKVGAARLLIVEDDDDVRQVLEDVLKNDFAVLSARNGREALEKALKCCPDLIVSDVMMPELNGYELCNAIRNSFKTSHIPVILLTAKAGLENKIEGLNSGADAFIEKPFNIHHLKAEIQNLLDNRQKLKDHFKKSLSMQPGDLDIPSQEEKFIRDCLKIIEANIDDVNFGVVEFGREIGLSRTQLFRKLKSLIGQTPTEFIYSTRLKRAAQLLEDQHISVAEAAYLTGFSNPSSFSTAFRKHFGKSPKSYLATLSKRNQQ